MTPTFELPAPGRKRYIRYRVLVGIAAVAVIALGLLSRSAALAGSGLFATYGGDVLWAALVALLLRWLWPGLALWRSALSAGCFALGIELSQLYHAPWIDALRQHRIGGLVLGFGFAWSDLACYALGILLAWAGELAAWRMAPTPRGE